MAIVLMMKWNGMALDVYDQARQKVDWEGNPPPGAISHVCAADGGNLHVIDVWESEQQFNTFVETRLMPVLVSLSVTEQPEVQVLPVHARFAPLEK